MGWDEDLKEFRERNKLSEAPPVSPSKSSDLLKSKTAKLAAIGLRHNPCQGCEAYYTREGLFAGCAVESDGGCEWIRLHDDALAV